MSNTIDGIGGIPESKYRASSQRREGPAPFDRVKHAGAESARELTQFFWFVDFPHLLI